MSSSASLVDKNKREAHREAVTMAIADVAAYLQDVLGQKLVAYLANVKDPKTVGRWVSGDQRPQPGSEERLRTAYQVFHLLQKGDGVHVVRAWFVGMNPQLDDESPATAIRKGAFREVLAAAEAFLSGG